MGAFDSKEGWQVNLDQLRRSLEQIHQVASDPRARVTDTFPPRKSGEQIVPIIDALVNDRQGYFLVNVPNHGALPGVPDDVVVEVPALVDGKGIRRTVVERLPDRIMFGAILPQWLAMERRLAGYLTGYIRDVMQYMLAEHRSRPFEHAQEV